MSKTVVEYAARRVAYHTDLPFEEVTARLEQALNKPNAGPAVFRLIDHAETKDELDGGLRAIVDGHEFMYVPRAEFTGTSLHNATYRC